MANNRNLPGFEFFWALCGLSPEKFPFGVPSGGLGEKNREIII
jgi:hypothetical protein